MDNQIKQLIKFAERLQSVHTSSADMFPEMHQSLSGSVITWLAANYLGKHETSLKNVHLTLPYSERSIRTFLRNLENDGWVDISLNVNDKRHKNLTLTPKFINAFQKYYEEHKHFFSDVF